MECICQRCSVRIVPERLALKVKVGDEERNYHPECLEELLIKGAQEFQKVIKKYGLKPSKYQKWLVIQVGLIEVEKQIQNVLASPSLTNRIKCLAGLVSICQVYLGNPVNLPEPEASLVKKELEPPPPLPVVEPPLVAEPPLKKKETFSAAKLAEPNVFEGFERSELKRTIELLPLMRNDLLALAQRPVRLVFDETIASAATDTKENVWLNPFPFENGHEDLGFGMLYHEGGHIIARPGSCLMSRAREERREIVGIVCNLIIDRLDDADNRQTNPGFAPKLVKRLAYLFPRVRTVNPFEDFTYACKKGTSPHFQASAKAMKHVHRLQRRQFLKKRKATDDEILRTAQKAVDILREHIKNIDEIEESFRRQAGCIFRLERGPVLTAKQKSELDKAMRAILSKERSGSLKSIGQRIKGLPSSFGAPPPYRSNRQPAKIRKVETGSAEGYRQLINPAMTQLRKLIKTLSQLQFFEEYTIRFQEEGEIDPTALARLVVKQKDFKKVTFLERNLDLAVHIAVDQSGSMTGTKIEQAKQIAGIFNEAVLASSECVDGHVWGYHCTEGENIVYDYGPCRANLPIFTATAGGGNADWQMLEIVSRSIMRSNRSKKVIIILCDDGPTDPEEVCKLSWQLLRQGVLVIHCLAEVFTVPKIFPIQLLFHSFDELLEEFGQLFTKICESVL